MAAGTPARRALSAALPRPGLKAVREFGRLAAGGATFTVALGSFIGLGVWLSSRTGQPLYVLAGLLAGLLVSAYFAVRLLLR